MGAWLTYGLGTENANLPGYVVLCPDVPTTIVDLTEDPPAILRMGAGDPARLGLGGIG